MGMFDGLDDKRLDYKLTYELIIGNPRQEGKKTLWDIHGPQPAIVQLEDEGEIVGRVLDLVCGTGENSLFLSDPDNPQLFGNEMDIEMPREKFHELFVEDWRIESIREVRYYVVFPESTSDWVPAFLAKAVRL